MGVKLQSALGGSVELNAPSTASNFTMTVPAGNGTVATTDQILGFRNRIINGDMRIDQRNAGASVTAANLAYNVDRWLHQGSQASKLTVQQNAGSVTPPTGFTNYSGYTSTSAYSVTTNDFFLASQLIEGYNVADLSFGTASASAITLSFWVSSSLTGTFSGAIGEPSYTRGYIFTYTISSANTWEYKTITIPGDTSGTWAKNNAAGMRVSFNLGCGSGQSGTANSWGAWVGAGVTGATSVVGTSGATFYLTGVQLEKGSTATSFDYRPYGTELALCQRYYQGINSATHFSIVGVSGSSNIYSVPLIQTMRTSPSLSGNLSVQQYYYASAGAAQSSQAVAYASLSFGGGNSQFRIVTPQAGTTGLGTWLDCNSGSLAISAEL